LILYWTGLKHKDTILVIKPNGRALAILGFHKIGDPPPGTWHSWFYIPEKTFIEQLTCVREEGWHVVDITTLLTGFDIPEKLPDRTALLSFDDGYRSMRKVALPILKRFGFPAILFVPTDFIGGWNTFDMGAEPEESICDWDDLRDLDRQGVSIQSHGASHSRFSNLGTSEQEEEMLRSKTVLEEALGKSVNVIAYPYGDDGTNPDETERCARRIGYRAACLYGGGPIMLPTVNPYRLARIAMGPNTDLRAELSRTGISS
jgi:peptidoglycan/xylan/chitin deacetylase (PgdA/CDA1 family)